MASEESLPQLPPDPLRPPSWLGGGLSDTVFAAGNPLRPATSEELQGDFPGLRLEGWLGRGGMGAVYRGTELSTGRAVAVKVLPEELNEHGEGFRMRFEQEAAVMSRLDHPHVVRLYHHGVTGSGRAYLLMELVEGEDVARRLHRERRLDAITALGIAQQVCGALEYAHGLGVIHRDIKPGNILLTTGGQVKVADFGLARLEDESGLSGLTQSFHMMGSLDYQAPEALILGAEVDERADLYAVGVMLYHMLVGQVPRGIFHLPSKLHPELDPRIDTLLSNLLQQNPYERTANARDLGTALQSLVEKVPAKPSRAWWKGRWKRSS